MPVLGNYFIDATSLSFATAVFIDAGLSTPAADGYYADGNTVRLQTNGVLGPIVVCPNCDTVCNQAISVNSTQGLYKIAYDASAVSGILITWFRPIGNNVSGIRLTYDSNEYSSGTSENFGFFEAASQSNFSFLGVSAGDCGIAAALNGGGYNGLDENVFNGATFDTVANNATVTGSGTDVNTEATTLGWCTLYTSYTGGISTTVLAEIASMCATAEWEIEIPCPATLTGVQCSLLNGVCGDPKPQTFYNVPNRNGTPGVPAVNEFMVRTSDGELKVATSPANAGDFCIENINGDEQIITVDQNSVITNIVNCP